MTGEALALKITNNPDAYAEHEVLLAQTVHAYTIRLMRWSKWGQDVQAERDAARAALGDMREVLLTAGYAAATRESSVRDLRDLVLARNDAIGDRDAARAEVVSLKCALAAKENECYAIASDDIDALRAQHQQELQAARAEVAALDSKLTYLSGEYAALEDKAEQAEAEVARLREALNRHGIHDVVCAKRRSLFAGIGLAPCDCGFDAALAGKEA